MRLIPLVAKDLRKAQNKTGYLLTSKLMCNPCYLTINLVNERLRININTIGTHGKTYPGWEPPPDISTELLGKIASSLSGQVESVYRIKNSIEQRTKEIHNTRTKDEMGFERVGFKLSDTEIDEIARIVISESGFNKMIPDEPSILSNTGTKRLALLSQQTLSGRNITDELHIATSGGASGRATPLGDSSRAYGMASGEAAPIAPQRLNQWYDQEELSNSISRQAHTEKDNIRICTNIEGLLEALENLPTTGDFFIAMNVNVISRNFEEGTNNHWVGIHITRNAAGSELKYFDPMGQKIGSEIMEHLNSREYVVAEPSFGKQTQLARIGGTREIPIVEGNTNDCGPMLGYLFGLSSQNRLTDIKTMTEEESNSLGQSIRRSDKTSTEITYSQGTEATIQKKPTSYSEAAHSIRETLESSAVSFCESRYNLSSTKGKSDSKARYN